ncbi:MAG: discoidin domain-containing protein [Deltaproteobacteria bacterium]|nr:discoidin domain-containing protein [Deltaproteobacteria bacterium]
MAVLIAVAGCSDARTRGDPPDDPYAGAILGSCARGSEAAVTAPGPSAEGDVVTSPATSLGQVAFSANGRVQPRGKPTTYYFEYGPTRAYGNRTPPRALPPRLGAFYKESWDTGLGGWKGGSGPELIHVPTGGVSGGFVQFRKPSAYDYNHVDGIGILHLPQYMYPAPFAAEPTASFGGDRPDLRGARVKLAVRGNEWVPRTAELVWWLQSDVWRGKPPDGAEPRYANWAHTGFLLTDALAAGTWQSVEYRLENDTSQWTYAGTNRELNTQLGRSIYHYAPLDDALGLLDVNFFHVLVPVDPYDPPRGSIDFDEFEIAYRNYSVVTPSNGGKIASVPAGSSDPATLTDGWRNGPGRMWASPPSPVGPQEIVFDLERPVVVERVQIHQSTEWPSQGIEVLVSPDGTTWSPLVAGTLPETSPVGENFAFFLAKDLAATAKRIMVRITSGFRAERWGLGEVEIYGTGAVMRTDDDWYRVNADIGGLAAGDSVHFRLVADIDGKTEVGADQVHVVPANQRPEVATRGASGLGPSTARLEGRLNTLGAEAVAFFEYGTDDTYGRRTRVRRMGPEITPRTVFERIDGLSPGSIIHYRLVSSGVGGTRCGADATFVAR